MNFGFISKWIIHEGDNLPHRSSLSVHRARQCQMEVKPKNHHVPWRNVCVFQSKPVYLTVVLFSTGCRVELNMSTRAGGGGNNSSLPGTPGDESGSANRVLSWAVSFEKLLEDPCGVDHFTVSSIFQELLEGFFMSWAGCVFTRYLPL